MVQQFLVCSQPYLSARDRLSNPVVAALGMSTGGRKGMNTPILRTADYDAESVVYRCRRKLARLCHGKPWAEAQGRSVAIFCVAS